MLELHFLLAVQVAEPLGPSSLLLQHHFGLPSDLQASAVVVRVGRHLSERLLANP